MCACVCEGEIEGCMRDRGREPMCVCEREREGCVREIEGREPMCEGEIEGCVRDRVQRFRAKVSEGDRV